MNRTLCTIAILLSAAASIGPLSGQGLTAQISATVVDGSGGSIPGAAVDLLNSATGQRRQAKTDAQGNVVFLQLLPSTYELTVTAGGFKKYEQKGIILTSTERAALNRIVLEVGDLTQSVSVSADAVRIQTQSAERAGVINSSQMLDIGQKGRDYQGLLRLLPGVIDTLNRDSPGFGGSGGIQIYGARAGNFSMDGVSMMDSGNQSGVYLGPTIDAISEVRALLANYQAEYGRSTTTINIVIKNGTKQFHGSAYFFKRNEALNANEFFNNRQGVRRPRYRYDEPGYTIGGPVLIPGLTMSREKLFFFWSDEYMPLTKPTNQGRMTFPTALERSGNFSQTLDTNGALIPILDPLNNRIQFPGNVIPTDRINKAGQTLLSVFPLPNATDPAHTFNNVFQDTTHRPRRDHILRIDWNIGPKTTFYVRGILDYEYYQGKYDIPAGFTPGIATGIAGYPQFPIKYEISSRGLQSNLIHTFTPTLLNEFTFGVNRARQNVIPLYDEGFNGIIRSKIGLNLPQFHPEINPLNLIPNATFGGVSNEPRLNIETRTPFYGRNNVWDYTDNLSKIWGRHTLKAGFYAEVATRNAAAYSGVGFMGLFDFGRNINNPYDSNYAFSNAVLGSVNSYSEPDNRPNVHGRYKEIEWFVQDNWRLSKRFTLELGVRFYRVGAVWSAGDLLASFQPADFNPATAPLLIQPYRATPSSPRQGRNPLTGEIFPEVKIGSFAIGSGQLYDGMRVVKERPAATPPIMAAPRFGFAWDVFGDSKLAVRGGFGIFPTRYGNDTVVNLGSQPPVAKTATANYTTIPDLLATPLSLSPSNVLGFDVNGKATKAYNWSFGIQRSIGFATVLDVAYVAQVTRNLSELRELNGTPYGTNLLPTSIDPTLTGNLPLPPNFLRPIRGMALISYRQFAGSSNYHSMQTQLNRRLTRNLSFGVAWTWSKFMESGPINPFLNNRWRNYAKGTYDRTHNFVVNYIYTIPKVSPHWNNVFSRQILDNWTVSGITSFLSGAPLGFSYSFVKSFDITAGATGLNVDSRVILSGNPILPKNERTVLRHFRTEVVKPPDPANFGIGNAARDAIRGPGLNNWDISIFKTIPLGKKEAGRQLQFRCETYNTFNHTQFTGVDTAARFDTAGQQVNSRFGQYTASTDGRRVQFGVKLQF